MDLHIVSIEHTLTKPDLSLGDAHMCQLFHRVSARCPVLHLFGFLCTAHSGGGEVLPQRRSACVHVHGVYPYFMVPQYDTRVSAAQFAAQLEAVAAAAAGDVSAQILHDVQIVQRVPFYGYHATARSFFLVRVVDAAAVKKLVALLGETTRVGGRRWQAYEAHEPFHTQFMTNYAVNGMASFRIPSCSARSPVPPDLCGDEIQKQWGIKHMSPFGEPPRLTRADLELDVDATVLCRPNAPMEPGDNLISARQMVQNYFCQNGVDDSKRKEAAIDAIERRCSVATLQEEDPVVIEMRSRELKHVRTRMAAANEQNTMAPPSLDSYVAPSPQVFDSPNKDGLTQQLMDGFYKSPMRHISFTTQSSAESEDDMEEADDEKQHRASITQCIGEDADKVTDVKLSLTNSETKCATSPELGADVTHSQHADDQTEENSILFSNTSQEKEPPPVNFIVGDSVAFVTGSQRTAAVIVALCPNAKTVRLRWYIALSETHLADSASELERRGRWLRDGREVLFSDVEDENPIAVLAHARRAVVFPTHSEYCRSAAHGDASRVVLLCRYAYDVSLRRLSFVAGAVDECATFPAALNARAPPGALTARAGVVDDDDKSLFSSSSFSSSSSSSSSSSASFSSADSKSSHKRSEAQNDLARENLRHSVGAVRRSADASRLSLLLSASPAPFRKPHISPAAEIIDAAHSQKTTAAESEADVECVDAVLLRECKRDGFAIRASAVAGDLWRNYRCSFDDSRRRVVVSAARWPRSLHTAPQTSRSAAATQTRASLPLLSFVAPSQLNTQLSRLTVQERCPPRTNVDTSRAVSRGDCAMCSLRVAYVEVLVARSRSCQRGAPHMADNALLAVAIGRTESAQSTVGVTIFCVAPPGVPNGRQCFSGAAEVVFVATEMHLLRIVRRELRAHDPDVILSWEGLKYGIGRLALRYASVMRRSFARDLSRLTAAWQDTDKEDECAENEGSKYASACCSSSSSSSFSRSSSMSLPDDKDYAEEDAREGNNNETVRRVTRRFGAVLRIPGRVVVSLGRQLSKQLALPSHTLQMVHHHLFGEMLPHFDDMDLAEMYHSDETRRVVLSVLLYSVTAPHRVAHHLNFYTSTIEYASMFGILFYEVLSRGSQFRVESTLHRMARPLGYAMLSPSLAQVHKQPRLQSMPLVMQPRSGFYRDDPVVVLDFRSLYPSIIIAYNLCYTTCVGVVGSRRRVRLGVVPQYKKPDSLLRRLLSPTAPSVDGVTIAPNGCLFLPRSVRAGVLPRMLRALLDARFELQAALRHVAQPRGHARMRRVLGDRQAAMKLLANTTYGYTAASFSGRMPCRDVADAIVLLGRQALERAAQLINGHPAWQAEVVYGDTDSLFVRLPGRSREEAFGVAEEMARAVTAVNPAPVQLQVEKVLHPCLLLVKKRYVGYAYFRPEQQEPQFLAKGIETVRRDQCPATARILASIIKQLFAGAAPEEMRAHFYGEAGKIQRGVASTVDCIFRRAVKLGKYRRDANLPPGARLALQLMEKDITQTPYWGERVPYVVVHSTESNKLRDQVIHPRRLLNAGESFRIHSEYYMKHHIIPTLDRVLSLVGLSAARWYAEMPRKRTYSDYFDGSLSLFLSSAQPTAAAGPDVARSLKRKRDAVPVIVNVDVSAEEDTSGEEQGGKRNKNADDKHRNNNTTKTASAFRPTRRGTLDAYYQKTRCAVCHEECSGRLPPTSFLCDSCLRNTSASLARVVMRRHSLDQRLRLVETACIRCIGSCGEGGGPRYASGVDIEDLHIAIPRHTIDYCISIDCFLSFEKRRLRSLHAQVTAVEQFITNTQALDKN